MFNASCWGEHNGDAAPCVACAARAMRRCAPAFVESPRHGCRCKWLWFHKTIDVDIILGITLQYYYAVQWNVDKRKCLLRFNTSVAMKCQSLQDSINHDSPDNYLALEMSLSRSSLTTDSIFQRESSSVLLLRFRLKGTAVAKGKNEI